MMQVKGWVKGIAVGAAFAALVALPLVGQGAGKVTFNDLAHGSGGGAGKVSFQDLHFSKVTQQDFYFVMATGKHIKSATLT